MKKIVIFASGTGSNFEEIVIQSLRGNIDAEVALLVCDNQEAFVIEKANRYKIETCVFDPRSYASKKAYEQMILRRLKAIDITLIVLAGYMRLIGPTLLHAYPNRIINIHPSLLPAFKGLDAIGQAIKANVRVTGVTVHYVDAGMDTGRIIAQEALAITPPYHRKKIEHEIHQIEHKLYPKTIQQLLEERL
ncbi:MAG: phosphoribosylglycinamide formyltransferase [Candidatus Izemoplasma sp.]|nr:phosphoribosylglycinamide formyltransferase [Candidatus Izemoplasma sp.]